MTFWLYFICLKLISLRKVFFWHVIHACLVVFFVTIGDWTQGLMYARQALCHIVAPSAQNLLTKPSRPCWQVILAGLWTKHRFECLTALFRPCFQFPVLPKTKMKCKKQISCVSCKENEKDRVPPFEHTWESLWDSRQTHADFSRSSVIFLLHWVLFFWFVFLINYIIFLVYFCLWSSTEQ